jgi:hypothetical protein
MSFFDTICTYDSGSSILVLEQSRGTVGGAFSVVFSVGKNEGRSSRVDY